MLVRILVEDVSEISKLPLSREWILFNGSFFIIYYLMYEGSLWIIALYQVGLMSFDKQIRKGNLFMIVFLFLSNNR